MSDKDRQASLNFGYEGLLDMCRAIGISPKDVSLGGRLSIAFGARGSGNALAHYEPLREVIKSRRKSPRFSHGECQLDRNIHDNGKGQYEFNLFQ